MAITEIARQKRMYFFTGYLVEVVLENSGIGFRGLFLVLMPAKISPPMNITPPPPLINLLSFNLALIARLKI